MFIISSTITFTGPRLRIKDVKGAIASRKEALAAQQAALQEALDGGAGAEGGAGGIHPLERPDIPPDVKVRVPVTYCWQGAGLPERTEFAGCSVVKPVNGATRWVREFISCQYWPLLILWTICCLQGALFRMQLRAAEEAAKKVSLGTHPHTGEQLLSPQEVRRLQRQREAQQAQYRRSEELKATRRLQVGGAVRTALHQDAHQQEDTHVRVRG